MKQISKNEIIEGRRAIIAASHELIESIVKYDPTNPLGIKLIGELKVQISQVEAEIARLEQLGPDTIYFG